MRTGSISTKIQIYFKNQKPKIPQINISSLIKKGKQTNDKIKQNKIK